MAGGNQPGERFTTIFSAFMVFCVLVWLWGLGLFMLWPWQKGGEWLPDFPMVGWEKLCLPSVSYRSAGRVFLVFGCRCAG